MIRKTRSSVIAQARRRPSFKHAMHRLVVTLVEIELSMKLRSHSISKQEGASRQTIFFKCLTLIQEAMMRWANKPKARTTL